MKKAIAVWTFRQVTLLVYVASFPGDTWMQGTMDKPSKPLPYSLCQTAKLKLNLEVH